MNNTSYKGTSKAIKTAPSGSKASIRISNTLTTKTFSKPSFQSDSFKATFSTFRDPASKPFCDKGSWFEKNPIDLPEARLKLIINQKSLKNDEQALRHISLKLAEEDQAEMQRRQKFSENRLQLLISKQNRKQRIDNLEAKAGIIKQNLKKTQSWTINPRIDSLAKPKTVKKGFAEDYLDSFGLLNAGVLQGGKSVLPRSARVPGIRIHGPFPKGVAVRKSETCEKPAETKDEDLYSEREIRECIKDINVFHNRIGRGRGKVGFPQIFLEEYKESN